MKSIKFIVANALIVVMLSGCAALAENFRQEQIKAQRQQAMRNEQECNLGF